MCSIKTTMILGARMFVIHAENSYHLSSNRFSDCWLQNSGNTPHCDVLLSQSWTDNLDFEASLMSIFSSFLLVKASNCTVGMGF